MMDQFQKLQLELDENRSRMATMKKEHEAIIRENRAYTESLEQMQGKAQDSGYYHHAASALPVGSPATMQPGAANNMQDKTNINRSIPQPLWEPTHDMPHGSGNQEPFPPYEPPQPQPPNRK